MTSPEAMTDALRGLLRAFEGCAAWSVRSMLETQVSVSSPFRVASAVPSDSRLYCILPASSPAFYALLCLGVEQADLGPIFPDHEGEKAQMDALGETTRLLAGIFLSEDAFIDVFGKLTPTSPFFSDGAFTSHEDLGIHGEVTARGKSFFLNFSIRDIQKA